MKCAVRKFLITRLKSIDTCEEDDVYMAHYKTNVEI